MNEYDMILKSVDIFADLGHFLTEEDVVITRETVEDFQNTIITRRNPFEYDYEGVKAYEFVDVSHISGKKLEYLVILDFGDKRVVCNG